VSPRRSRKKDLVRASTEGQMIGAVRKNMDHIRFLRELRGKGDLGLIKLDAGTSLMVCRGEEKCIYFDTCEFCREDAGMPPPIGAPCPYEVLLMSEKYDRYCELICPQRENTPMMSLIKDIVVLEMLVTRAQKAMSSTGAVVEEVTVGCTPKGVILTRSERSAALMAYESLLRNKLRLMSEMGLTPRARAQIGTTIAKDPSTHAAELVAKFKEIMQRRERERRDAGEKGPYGEKNLPSGDAGGNVGGKHGAGDPEPDDVVDAEYVDIDDGTAWNGPPDGKASGQKPGKKHGEVGHGDKPWTLGIPVAP